MAPPLGLPIPALALALAIAAGLGVEAAAIRALHSASQEIDDVVAEQGRTLMLVQRVHILSERTGRIGRSLALTGHRRLAAEYDAAQRELDGALALLQARMGGDGPILVSTVQDLAAEHRRATDYVITRKDLDPDDLLNVFDEAVQPITDRLTPALDRLTASQEQRLERARASAFDRISGTVRLLVVCAIAAFVATAVLSVLLVRSVRRLLRSRSELGRLSHDLRAANEDLGAFAARAAHDLGNLLGPLVLTIQRIERSPEDAAIVHSGLRRMARTVERGRGLLDDMLAFARAGGPEPGQAASVREAIRGAIDDLHELRLTVDATVDTDVEDVRVRCGPGLLHSLVVNLLGNALKFVIGCPVRRVSIQAHGRGGDCELVVEDTGPGMSEEVRAHAFRPFYRAPGSTVPGTGLGLATVHRIVAGHGGTIEIASRPGQGTRFTVRLPRAEEPECVPSLAGPARAVLITDGHGE